jgi:hypothetical protein
MGVAVRASAKPAELEPGHARGTTSSRREQQPRIPLIGVDAGAIPGTKPGCSARELERAGREIVRSRMALAREKLKQGGRS